MEDLRLVGDEDFYGSIEGNISSETGFLRDNPLSEVLPEKYAKWEEFVKNMPQYFKTFQFCQNIEALPLLDIVGLEDKFLPRASILLSAMAHGYRFEERFFKDMPGALPESIFVPWEAVCKKLQRKYPSRNVIDDFLNNWDFLNASNSRSFKNLKLLVSYFDLQEESVSTLVIPAIEANFTTAIRCIFDLKRAVESHDDQKVTILLKTIAETVGTSKKILKEISPSPKSETFVDPVIWSKTFAMIGKSTHEQELANSGSDTPMFHVMDALLGRVSYVSCLGVQFQERKKQLPENYRKFFDYLSKINLRAYVDSSDNAELKEAFSEVANAYQKVLNFHKIKAYGYMKLAVLAGRIQTNNKTTGSASCENPVWEKIHADFEHSIGERPRAKSKKGSVHQSKVNQSKMFFSAEPLEDVAIIPYSELVLHNKEDDCWTSIDGLVYDFTDYIRRKAHPGGNKIITISAGADSTVDFEKVGHASSDKIKGWMKKYLKGCLENTSLYLDQDSAYVFKSLCEVVGSIVSAENILQVTSRFDTKNTQEELPYFLKLDTLENLYAGALSYTVKCIRNLFNRNDADFLNEIQDLYQASRNTRREIQGYVRDNMKINEIIDGYLATSISRTEAFLESFKVLFNQQVQVIESEKSCRNINMALLEGSAQRMVSEYSRETKLESDEFFNRVNVEVGYSLPRIMRQVAFSAQQNVLSSSIAFFRSKAPQFRPNCSDYFKPEFAKLFIFVVLALAIGTSYLSLNSKLGSR